MKILLIVIAILVIAGVAFEVVSRIVAKQEKTRFDAMSPDEQRKEQARLYKRQQMG